MEVNIVRSHPDAVLPKYATDLSSGFDLVAVEGKIIGPNSNDVVSIGLKMAIPEGYELQIRPRSGKSLKTSIRVANSPGTIDADYRGEIKVILDNIGDFKEVIEKGERIAQGVICPVTKVTWKEVETLDVTERAEGGFGHTGSYNDGNGY